MPAAVYGWRGVYVQRTACAWPTVSGVPTLDGALAHTAASLVFSAASSAAPVAAVSSLVLVAEVLLAASNCCCSAILPCVQSQQLRTSGESAGPGAGVRDARSRPLGLGGAWAVCVHRSRPVVEWSACRLVGNATRNPHPPRWGCSGVNDGLLRASTRVSTRAQSAVSAVGTKYNRGRPARPPQSAKFKAR